MNCPNCGHAIKYHTESGCQLEADQGWAVMVCCCTTKRTALEGVFGT
jgi:hypothetical protein